MMCHDFIARMIFFEFYNVFDVFVVATLLLCFWI